MDINKDLLWKHCYSVWGTHIPSSCPVESIITTLCYLHPVWSHFSNKHTLSFCVSPTHNEVFTTNPAPPTVDWNSMAPHHPITQPHSQTAASNPHSSARAVQPPRIIQQAIISFYICAVMYPLCYQELTMDWEERQSITFYLLAYSLVFSIFILKMTASFVWVGFCVHLMVT